MKNRIFIFLAAAVAVGFLAQSAPVIQSSMAKGTIHGVVTDPSGAVIPGAKVKVSAGELIQTVATGETGQYAISGLPPGHYRVRIHTPGFSAFDKTGFVIWAGHETEADAQLTISALKQEVTVTAGTSD